MGVISLSLVYSQCWNGRISFFHIKLMLGLLTLGFNTPIIQVVLFFLHVNLSFFT